MSKIPLRFYPHCAAHYTQRIRMSLTSRVIAIHRHKGGSCTSSRSYKGNTDRNKGGRIRKGFQTNTLKKTINSYVVSPTRRWTSRKHSQTEHCRISERSHFWKRSAKTGSSKPQKKNYMKKNCKLQSVSRYQGGSIHRLKIGNKHYVTTLECKPLLGTRLQQGTQKEGGGLFDKLTTY